MDLIEILNSQLILANFLLATQNKHGWYQSEGSEWLKHTILGDTQRAMPLSALYLFIQLLRYFSIIWSIINYHCFTFGMCIRDCKKKSVFNLEEVGFFGKYRLVHKEIYTVSFVAAYFTGSLGAYSSLKLPITFKQLLIPLLQIFV